MTPKPLLVMKIVSICGKLIPSSHLALSQSLTIILSPLSKLCLLFLSVNRKVLKCWGSVWLKERVFHFWELSGSGCRSRVLFLFVLFCLEDFFKILWERAQCLESFNLCQSLSDHPARGDLLLKSDWKKVETDVVGHGQNYLSIQKTPIDWENNFNSLFEGN